MSTMTCLVGKKKHTSPFVKVAFPGLSFISELHVKHQFKENAFEDRIIR